MDRVSGWYKRHVAKITLVVGAILVVLLNINALTIGRTLYTESAVSTAVSMVAAKGANCPASPNPQACPADLQARLSAAATAACRSDEVRHMLAADQYRQPDQHAPSSAPSISSVR